MHKLRLFWQIDPRLKAYLIFYQKKKEKKKSIFHFDIYTPPSNAPLKKSAAVCPYAHTITRPEDHL